MGNEIKNIGSEIEKFLEKIQKNEKFLILKLKKAWPEMVGEILARHSFVIGYDNKKLLVGAQNSICLADIMLYKKEIIEKIKRKFPEIIIEDITLKIRQKKEKSIEIEEKDNFIYPEKIKLSEEIEEKIIKKFKNIKDENLKNLLNNLAFEAKRKTLAQEEKGYKECLSCGNLCPPPQKTCIFCRVQLENEQINELYKVLKKNPLITWQEVKKEFPCEERHYREARRFLIYRYIDRIYYSHDSEDDRWLLVRLITGLKGEELTLEHRDNILKKFRRKEDVFTYRS